jgi:hypothetical protein
MGQIKHALYELVEFVVSSLSEGYELEEIDELVENNFPEQYEFYLDNKEFIMEEVDTRIDDDEDYNYRVKGKPMPYMSKPLIERLVDDSDDRERSIDLRGPQGNAFAILGIAKDFTRQLKEMDPKKYNWERIQSEMTSGTYTNLVHTFEKYFGDYITIYGADVLKESFDDNTHPGIDRYLDSNYQDSKYVSDSLRYNENPVDDFKLYFREHYPHIYCELSNREISKFLTSNHIMSLPIEQKADLFSDYLMSQGLCDVDESLDECCGGGIVKRPRPVRRPTSTNLPPKPRRLHESDYIMPSLFRD